MIASEQGTKKFSVQEMTCANVDVSDPRFYVIAGIEVPRIAFETLSYHTPQYGDYWHGVLSSYWEIANFSDFLMEATSPKYIVMRPRMSSDKNILLPVDGAVSISQHDRIVFDN